MHFSLILIHPIHNKNVIVYILVMEDNFILNENCVPSQT